MRVFVLLSILCTLAVAAEDFPPIPPEAWKTGVEESKGTGAVILEKQVLVSNRYVDTRLRIRVLTEAGKSAVEFGAFGKDAYDILGRTVHPGGGVTPFTKKDLKDKTVVKVGSKSVERTILIPPAVTADCIVDIKWRESKPYHEPVYYGFGSMDSFTLSGASPVKNAVVEIPRTMPWAWSLVPGKAGKVAKEERGTAARFTLSDLPPLEDTPYSIPGNRKPAMLLLWCNPQTLYNAMREGADAYWNEVGRLILKRDLEEGLTLGKAYQALSAELRKDRPAGTHDFAIELARRLDGRIRNLSAPTYDEKARQSKDEAKQEIQSRDFRSTAERGATDNWGMVCLYLRLLKDEGLKPKVALVADRDRWIFNRTLLTYQQFHDVLIGVEEPSKGVVWIDPAWRFANPGLIHPDFQGTPALSFDTTTWAASTILVPVQEAKVNQRHSSTTLELAEDEDRFTSTVRFSGIQEIQQRRRYMAYEPKEQNRLLKEQVEKDSPRFSLTKAEVRDATNPRKDLNFHLEGRIERESGRRREVEPFPMDPWPLWVPDRLDANRTELIALPHALVHSATSRFTVPKGYSLGKVEPIGQSNAFGSVSWELAREAKDGGESCTVSLRVEVVRTIASAGEYEAFRTFLGWVREACGRTLVLERAR